MPHYVNTLGEYLGNYFGTEPKDSILIEKSPTNKTDVWDFQNNEWVSLPIITEEKLVPLAAVILRLLATIDIGNIGSRYQQAKSVMNKEEQDYLDSKLLTVVEGVLPNDPTARSLISLMGANPDIILATPEKEKIL